MKKFYSVICIILFPFSLISQSIILESFGPTFNYPTNIKNAGDSRMFISEQEGFIKIINSDGSSPATPFLDIDSKVYDSFMTEWERGLLGFVFHPNYSSNGYFYVHYVDQSGDSVISRFSVSGNPNIADASSELVILNIPHPYDAHYGGDLEFGPDGFLYISKGDGGSSEGDPENRSQNLNELLGKILRIDVDNTDPGKNYAIPNSNPFANDGDPNTRGEIWAYGFRNPSKFSFDSSTGDLWIGDVGQKKYEEINLNAGNAGGLNFGWRCYEGTDTFNTSAGCPPINTITFPVNQYLNMADPGSEPDGATGCAVAAGYMHRGSENTNLNGNFFFGDWCSGQIFMLENNGGSWDRTVISPSVVGSTNWVAFGQDNNNELYVLSNPLGTGYIFKIKQNTLSSPSSSNLNFSLVPNPSNSGNITLNFSKSIDLKEVNTYNLQGQLIKQLRVGKNLKSQKLNLHNISSGLYIIEVISKNGNKNQNKLIIK